MPPTIPEAEPTVPIAVFELDHVPPPEFDKVVVPPIVTVSEPVIADGCAFTSNAAVLFDDTLVLHDEALVMLVMVTVVAPTLASEPEGIVNVPLLAPITSDAVAPVALLAPLRL